MVSALGYFAIIMGGIQALGSLAFPWVMHLSVGWGEHQDKAIAETVDMMFYQLLINAVLGVATIVVGYGLLRRRNWARHLWLWANFVTVGILIIHLMLPDVTAGMLTLGVLFYRAALCVASVRILTNETARKEFTGVKAC